MLYAVATEEMRAAVKEQLAVFGELAAAARYFAVKEETLELWKNRSPSLPVWFLTRLFGREELFNRLDGCWLSATASQARIRFRTELSPAEAVFLGWFLTEGSSSTSTLVICQQDPALLERLKEVIAEAFDSDSSRFHIVRDGNDCYKLKLPLVLQGYLEWCYAMPRGSKSHLVRIPAEVLHGNESIRCAFVAACLEGDGSFSYYRRTLRDGSVFDAPRIDLTTASRGFAEDFHELLLSLGCRATWTRDDVTTKLVVSRLEDVVRLYRLIQPFCLTSKSRATERLLRQPQPLESMLVPARDLVLRARDKLDGWKARASFVTERGGYAISHQAVRNWGGGAFRPPLGVVAGLCELLGEDVNRHVTPEQAFVLSRVRSNEQAMGKI